MRRRRIALDPALIFTSNTTEDHAKRGEASLEPLLAAGATAVFCYNDTAAIGLLTACYQHGVCVPDSLSVIGFDDIQSAAYQNPGLTTIRQPLREMGMTAAETLVQRISAPKNAEYPRSIVVEPELIIRGSTAAASRPA